MSGRRFSATPVERKRSWRVFLERGNSARREVTEGEGREPVVAARKEDGGEEEEEEDEEARNEMGGERESLPTEEISAPV